MPYLNEIVTIINSTLETGKLVDDKRFIKQYAFNVLLQVIDDQLRHVKVTRSW